MVDQLEISPSENKWRTALPLIIIMVGIGAASLVLGFGLGKYQTPPKTTSAKTSDGSNSTFLSKSFSIDYPRNWTVKEHSKTDPAGAKISYRGNSVEFWVESARDYRFSDGQKASQTAQKSSTITVDGRIATLTVVNYKKGDVFLIVGVPATNIAGSVIFWASAADQNFKQTVTNIISSYKHQ